MTDVDLFDDGTPYMVMEYLEGRPLDAVIESEPPHDITSAVDSALETLAGLTAATRRRSSLAPNLRLRTPKPR